MKDNIKKNVKFIVLAVIGVLILMCCGVGVIGAIFSPNKTPTPMPTAVVEIVEPTEAPTVMPTIEPTLAVVAKPTEAIVEDNYCPNDKAVESMLYLTVKFERFNQLVVAVSNNPNLGGSYLQEILVLGNDIYTKDVPECVNEIKQNMYQAVSHFYLGVEKMTEGDYDSAIKYIQRATEYVEKVKYEVENFSSVKP